MARWENANGFYVVVVGENDTKKDNQFLGLDRVGVGSMHLYYEQTDTNLVLVWVLREELFGTTSMISQGVRSLEQNVNTGRGLVYYYYSRITSQLQSMPAVMLRAQTSTSVTGTPSCEANTLPRTMITQTVV